MVKPMIYLQCNSESGDGESHKYTLNFNPPLDLTDGEYVLTLDSLYHYYSFYNISAALGNNTLSYYDGSTNHAITIPDGIYSVELLNSYLHSVQFNNGSYTLASGIYTYGFDVLANNARLTIDINLNLAGYTVDLSSASSTLNELLGWPAAVVSVSGTGTSHANINNGVNSLALECSIVAGGYAGSSIGGAGAFPGQIIANWLPNNPPGSSISFVPYNHIWQAVSKKTVDSISFRVLSQAGALIDLNGEPFVANIIITKAD